MREPELARALAAAAAIATSSGLAVEDAVVLNSSNKLTARLLPCDVVARVAPPASPLSPLEVPVARRLAELSAPIAALDARVPPRAHARDGFEVTFWTHHATSSAQVPAAACAEALERLHTALRAVDVPAPRFTERVATARRSLADRERTPGLSGADRALLDGALRDLARAVEQRGAPEQLLHGEPHPGNVLATRHGPLFVDFETVCRGPVEFDLAHAPEGVGEHSPGVDRDLLRTCRLLASAVATTWRFDRDDRLPGGAELGRRWLEGLRTAL